MEPDRSTVAASGSDRGPLARYTPDGALGRLLLATLAAPVAVVAFWFAIVGFAVASGLGTALGVFYGGLSVGATVLVLLLLWPVYLSLIGELESTADYRGWRARSDGGASHESQAVATLKREYAAGELSESEFERRLERVLGVEAAERVLGASRSESVDRGSAERPLDRIRVRETVEER